MISIKTTPEFDKWLGGIKDRMTRIRLAHRIDKAHNGNLGDVKAVGSGVFEMREHFGHGWRMYYTQRGEKLIIMLAGGGKRTQEADIARAIKIAAELED
jgi:putative addiction module killer protein